MSDWRSETIDRARAGLLAADPEMVEETKWVKPSNPAGVPTFSCSGLVCTAETYKDKVKLTFAKGASLADPAASTTRSRTRIARLSATAPTTTSAAEATRMPRTTSSVVPASEAATGKAISIGKVWLIG